MNNPFASSNPTASISNDAAALQNTATNAFQNAATGAQTTFSDTLNSAATGLTDTFNEFKSKADVGAASLLGQTETPASFLETNGIVAKFVFVFFVTVVFLILFQIGMRIVGRVYEAPRDVILIDGVVGGTARIKIKQHTASQTNTPIYRSNNEDTGMEFTWAVWVYIDPREQVQGVVNKYSHVFSKGDTTINSGIAGSAGNSMNTTAEGILSPNNAPGLYVKSAGGKTVMRVYMDDMTENQSYVELDNIPLRKWVHVAILLKNMDLDVYVNGAIASRKKMAAVPKQNYGDVLIGYTDLNGNIASLSYYDSALSALQLSNLVKKGPNTQSAALMDTSAANYLSRLWYSDKWSN